MTYNKPDVHILGSASAVIEQINPKAVNPTDGTNDRTHNSSAYDLDE